MKKKSKIWITVGAVAGVVLIAGALFSAKYSQGSVTTGKPVQILSVNRKSSVIDIVQELNPVTIQNVVVVDGVESPLLATFQDKGKAMRAAKEKDADLLKLMKKKWNLDDLNASNWKAYEQHLDQYNGTGLPDDLGGDRYNDQRNQLQGFLEIYGDDEELNQQTLRYIRFTNSLLGTKLIRQISFEPVVGNFPEDAPIVERYQKAPDNTNPLVSLVNCQITITPEGMILDVVIGAAVVALVIVVIFRKKAAKKRNKAQSSKAE